jgi:hypothetical protein
MIEELRGGVSAMGTAYLRTGVVVAAVAFGGLAPAWSEDASLDADATKVVKAMSDYLGGLNAYTVSADVDLDVTLKTGEKYRLASSGTIALRRPGEVRVKRKGELADTDIIFDGKTLTVVGNEVKGYFQTEHAGTIDQLIDTLRSSGLEAPGADILYSNVYDGLMGGAWTAFPGGAAWINGVECQHIAVRSSDVDWQIWVQTGDKPLPCKYVISSKWMAGAPEYTIRFYDWNTEPALDATAFAFTPPEGYAKLDEAPADAVEQLAKGE